MPGVMSRYGSNDMSSARPFTMSYVIDVGAVLDETSRCFQLVALYGIHECCTPFAILAVNSVSLKPPSYQSFSSKTYSNIAQNPGQ